MADSGLRLLLILKKLPREPRFITTSQLQDQLLDDGYKVTLRTIQRDLNQLCSKFTIIQTEPTGRGKEGSGWAFDKNSKHTGIPFMEPSEALTLLMGIDHLQRILPPQVLKHLTPLDAEARDTLKNLDRRNYGKWMEKVRVIPQNVLLPAQVDTDTLESIYTALLDNKQFSACYRGRPDQVIHPYGLVQRGTTLYLLCRFFDFNDVRITAMHRFSDVEVLNEPVRRFPEFDIDDYIGSGEMLWPLDSNKIIKLKLRVNHWVCHYLTESALAEDQVIKPDDQKGWHRVTASVLDSHELRWWLMSQGDGLEVLGPKAVRNWFVEVAENLGKYYLS